MKKILNLVVLSGFFLFSCAVQAGSYDDFFKAIELDNPRSIAELLQRGFDPNTVDPQGTPALVRALRLQSYKAAGVLMDAPQIRVDARSPQDESALMLAALRGHEALVVKLVAHGAQVNKTGWTALHYAATAGKPRIVAFLIGAHAQVNAESPNGTTPLMMAAMYGNAETVQLLLESGAEAYPRNDNDLSAEDFAQRAGRNDALQLIRAYLAR